MVVKGICASRGKTLAPALVLKEPFRVNKETKDNGSVEKKLEKFDASVQKIADKLTAMTKRFYEKGQTLQGEIIDTHKALIQDFIFRDMVKANLKEGYILEASVARAADLQMEILLAMENQMIAQRAKDIEDVSRRLLYELRGEAYPDLSTLTESVILITKELSPSLLTSGDKEVVKGILMEEGSKTAHVSILAANMDIPTLVGCGSLENIKSGEIVYLNSIEEQAYLGMDSGEIKAAEAEVTLYKKQKTELEKYKQSKGRTEDGTRIDICGNIMESSGADLVTENGGDGIGLFRTEFLYMERKLPPTEDEQYGIYSHVVKALKGRPVTIRTIDIGADKPVDYLSLGHEENPFLGCRGIRLWQKYPDIARTQLRAILRASAQGEVRILLPMVTGIGEIKAARETIEAVKTELRQEDKAFDEHIKVGIMIEVPSAVIMADKLVKHVDFFSIGTNDLTQYLLAVDRGNKEVAEIYTPLNPAVLRMIKHTVDICEKHNKGCGVCGEMAGDPIGAAVLIGLGIKELSVNPNAILLIKHLISLVNQRELSELSESLLEMETPEMLIDLVKASLAPSYWEY